MNEYLNDCEVIEGGVHKWISPMEWVEKLVINNIPLEEFLKYQQWALVKSRAPWRIDCGLDGVHTKSNCSSLGFLTDRNTLIPVVFFYESILDRSVIRVIVHSMNQMPKKLLRSIPEHQIEEFQGLIYKLYQCCQKRMHHQSEKFDIPDSELRCLRLFGQERYLTAKGIATQMGVVKSRISKIIDGLARRGLIQRYKDPEDSRVTLLRLTPKGQKKLDRINTYLFSANMDILFQISPEQRSPLMVHLEVLRAAMDSVSNK